MFMLVVASDKYAEAYNKFPGALGTDIFLKQVIGHMYNTYQARLTRQNWGKVVEG